MSIESGILYVVATPIGNLDDLSPRALEVLKTADLIAAEDTRHTKRLLNHFAVSTGLTAVHEHNEQQRIPQLLAVLKTGQNIALVSDAGTPLVSDPGFRLVRSARQQRLPVVPVPGPCSAIAALSVAGLATDRFLFEGFLPAKQAARRRRLEVLQDSPYTTIFFESSHRIVAMLNDIAAVFGAERQALLIREMTKRFEQSCWDELAAIEIWLEEDPQRCKGEFVLVVQGAELVNDDEVMLAAKRLLAILIHRQHPLKQAVAITAEYSGLNRNRLYQLALELSA